MTKETGKRGKELKRQTNEAETDKKGKRESGKRGLNERMEKTK